MPPSGFEKVETRILGTFSENILSRFFQEVEEGKFKSVDEGITSELGIIERHLSLDISHAERGILEFVKQLYLDLQKGESLEQIIDKINALSKKHYS